MSLNDYRKTDDESERNLEKQREHSEPLLLDQSRVSSSSATRAQTSDDAMFDPANAPPTTSRMASLFCRLAIPAILTNTIEFATAIVNAVFAGRMNDLSLLATVGLSNVICQMMVLSLLIGLNSAQETLTSQAFGYGNKRMCGVYLNRGRLILTLFFIPLAFIPLNYGESILLAMGQDPEVARMTQIQLWYQMPAMFFFGHYDLYKRWLACMRITFVPMVAMFVATFLHIPLCFLYVDYFDMGIRGLGLATSTKDFVMLLIVLIYGNCSAEIQPALSLPDRESFRGWCEYLKISLPSTIMICAEWWALEILILMAGNLGVPEQAAQTMTISIQTTLYMVSLGIQEATCGIIGNCIGSNNVPLAKRFFSFTTKVNTVTSVILSILLLSFRSQIIRFYTVDEQLHELLMPVLALLAFALLFDCSQGYLQGPIRAMGLQNIASCCAITCYYAMGLPLSWLIAFKLEAGIIGLQWGATSAAFVQCLCYSLILLCTDWQNVSDRAIARMEKAEEETLRENGSKEDAKTNGDFTKVV